MVDSTILKLNVGGQKFQTYLSTFNSVPLLYARFSSDNLTFKIDKKGYFYLDRDPDSFSMMLKVCRGYYGNFTEKEFKIAKEEMNYWGSDFPVKIDQITNMKKIKIIDKDKRVCYLPKILIEEFFPYLNVKLLVNSKEELKINSSFPIYAIQCFIYFLNQKLDTLHFAVGHLLRLKFGLNESIPLSTQFFELDPDGILNMNSKEFTLFVCDNCDSSNSRLEECSCRFSDGTNSIFSPNEDDLDLFMRVKQKNHGKVIVCVWDVDELYEFVEDDLKGLCKNKPHTYSAKYDPRRIIIK